MPQFMPQEMQESGFPLLTADRTARGKRQSVNSRAYQSGNKWAFKPGESGKAPQRLVGAAVGQWNPASRAPSESAPSLHPSSYLADISA